MQQWTITVEFYPGSILERDRWFWQMKEQGDIVEADYGSDPEYISEDIALALQRFSEER